MGWQKRLDESVASGGQTTESDGYLLLEHGTSRLVLDPRRGGSLREFVWRGVDILRPTCADLGDDPFDTACFPMLPYVNRVAHGRFNFAGREVRLERNWNEGPHPLHGQGWRAPWTVAAASGSSATLRFEGGGDDWPWRYRAEQSFTLDVDRLTIELSVQNLSAAPMPVMLGLHPYFPDAAAAHLQARLPRIWLTDREALPMLEAATMAECGFDPPRALATVYLDHCFAGWDGQAVLRWPRHTVTLCATHCSHLHLYTPAGQDFFCVEPQTAAAGALVRAAGEAVELPTGARHAMEVSFSMQPTSTEAL